MESTTSYLVDIPAVITIVVPVASGEEEAMDVARKIVADAGGEVFRGDIDGYTVIADAYSEGFPYSEMLMGWEVQA